MILARMFALSILNALGFGNHVDLGTGVIADLIPAKKDYPGTKFPYLSTNLDFSTDKDFAKLVTAARIQNLKLRKDVVLSNPLLGGNNKLNDGLNFVV
ncbi:hypothetical protein [Nostoc sp.]|uniref:hypothetical protein n=1 Tax=Nostoc sp. TaxID=1180 RepID=UPI002FF8ECB4